MENRQLSIDGFVAHIPYAVVGSVVALVIGSFIGGLAYRFPEYYLRGRFQGARAMLMGRSACPSCGMGLKPAHMVPLVSFWVLKGKCGHCGAVISPAYSLCEGAALISFWLALWARPDLAGHVTLGLLGLLLMAVAIVDIKSGFIPDPFTVAIAVLGLVDSQFRPDVLPTLADGLAGAAVGGGLLWLVRSVYKKLRGLDGLGLGDVKLMAAAGLWVGWQGLGLTLFAAATAGLLAAALLRLRGQTVARETRLAFGPALCFGLLAVVGAGYAGAG